MADRFDPYREALVVERQTVWPEGLLNSSPAERKRIASALEADPAQAADLAYVRLYTGFCRRITVTPADIERLAGVSLGAPLTPDPSPDQPSVDARRGEL
jgi:hypothetical protein